MFMADIKEKKWKEEIFFGKMQKEKKCVSHFTTFLSVLDPVYYIDRDSKKDILHLSLFYSKDIN